MTTYALDTNIISYILKGDQNLIDRYRKENDAGNICKIPPIVYYEIKRGLLFSGATTKAKIFDGLCRQFDVGRMTIPVWNEAAQIYAANRHQGKTVEDADLLIAAFCTANNFVLVTNNTKHFDGIDGLKIENWV